MLVLRMCGRHSLGAGNGQRTRWDAEKRREEEVFEREATLKSNIDDGSLSVRDSGLKIREMFACGDA